MHEVEFEQTHSLTLQNSGLHGGVVGSNVVVPGSNPGWGLSVWSLHVLPVYAWVLSGYFGFLPPSKNMHVRLIDDYELSLGVSVSVYACVSRLSLCGCDDLATLNWIKRV